MIKRHEKWPRMLSDFIQDQHGKPFIWGERDCMIFAADAVWHLTGFDPAWNLRGTYETEDEANAIIHGAGGPANLCTRQIGLNASDARGLAKRGDVAMLRMDGRDVFGVVDDSGKRVACLDPISGIVRLPMRAVALVWSY